jgi:hypothetical protein
MMKLELVMGENKSGNQQRNNAGACIPLGILFGIMMYFALKRRDEAINANGGNMK